MAKQQNVNPWGVTVGAGVALLVLLVFGGEIGAFVDAVSGKAQALQRVGR